MYYSLFRYIIPLPVIHTFLENARIAAEAGLPYLGKSVDHYRVQVTQLLLLFPPSHLPPPPPPTLSSLSPNSPPLLSPPLYSPLVSSSSYRVLQPLESSELRVHLGLPARPGVGAREGEEGGVGAVFRSELQVV